MEKILIVDDDSSYLAFLKKVISESGYETDTADSPITAIELLAKKEYDLILSDLKLPEMDGIRFAKIAKTMQPSVKTIILTANPDTDSEIASIDYQLDQYLVKEKGIEVILKYIQHVLQREVSFEQDQVLRSKTNMIELHMDTHRVFKNGKEIDLTKKEYELLKMLLEHKNEVLTREQIIETISMLPLSEVDPRTVDVHIKNLRDKLRIFSIATIRGYGYKWNE